MAIAEQTLPLLQEITAIIVSSEMMDGGLFYYSYSLDGADMVEAYSVAIVLQDQVLLMAIS